MSSQSELPSGTRSISEFTHGKPSLTSFFQFTRANFYGWSDSHLSKAEQLAAEKRRDELVQKSVIISGYVLTSMKEYRLTR